MISLRIPNMSCGGCARSVQAAIREVDSTARVEPDLAARVVAVESTATEASLRRALEDVGYPPA